MGNDLLITNEIVFDDDETTKEIFFPSTVEETVVKERVIDHDVHQNLIFKGGKKNVGDRVLSVTAVKSCGFIFKIGCTG